jgi:hypothetical protein
MVFWPSADADGVAMEDYRIDACRWHVQAEAPEYRQRALDHFRDRYTVLLDFLREHDLLRDPSFGTDVGDWLAFEIHASDLTGEGLALFRACHGKWNPAFGQGNTRRHLVRWESQLAQLRREPH